MKPAFNFRNVFKRPILLYKFEQFTLENPIELRRLGTGALVVAFLGVLHLTLLNAVLGALMSINLVRVLYYTIGTYYLTNLLVEEHPFFDDKKPVRFIIDYVRYYVKIRKKWVIFIEDQEVSSLSRKITFKATKLGGRS